MSISVIILVLLVLPLRITSYNSNNLDYLTNRLNNYLQNLDQIQPTLLINQFQWTTPELKAFLQDTTRLCIQYATSIPFNEYCKANFDTTIEQVELTKEFQLMKIQLTSLLLSTRSSLSPLTGGGLGEEVQERKKDKLVQLKIRITSLIIEMLFKTKNNKRMQRVDYFLFYLMFNVYTIVGIFFTISWMNYYYYYEIVTKMKEQGGKNNKKGIK